MRYASFAVAMGAAEDLLFPPDVADSAMVTDFVSGSTDFHPDH